MARPSLSLIIITKNNGRTLRRCLDSADFVDEKILIDNASTDDTRDIAKASGARVVTTTDFPGFSAQKQRALDLATTDWILALDADEWIPAPLKAALLEALDNPGPHAGFDMPRHSSFAGGCCVMGIGRATGWSGSADAARRVTGATRSMIGSGSRDPSAV